MRILALLPLLLALTACAPYAHIAATPTSNPNGAARLTPRIASAAYTYEDENTIDIYLSDLTQSELANASGESSAKTQPGQIIHIQMFIRPRPGRTPIEPDALNASIRHAILAPNGAVGIYAGGGFLLPNTTARSGTFRGAITKGTLRLEAATPAFKDALGPSVYRATFKVRENDELATLMASRLADAATRTAGN